MKAEGSREPSERRIVPDQPGTWHYKASFVAGPDIAAQLTGGASAGYCDGDGGSFHIGPSDKDAPHARAKGMLQYTGGHYLQFADTGTYFLKGGADSPENFLAYEEIDNTYDADAGSGSYSHIGGFLHQYKPHVGDWRPGDPTWQNRDKGIIGALNYLASKSMNSVYFLTYNLDGGDGRDTWMWTDVDERQRFDCNKLDQWEIIFDHMDQLGINCEDWRSRDIMWEQTHHALTFFQTYLPFWDMTPANELTATKEDYCFAKQGKVYAIYLKNGGSTTLDFGTNAGPFNVQWYNPRAGGNLTQGTITQINGPGKVSIGTSKVDSENDWAVLIR